MCIGTLLRTKLSEERDLLPLNPNLDTCSKPLPSTSTSVTTVSAAMLNVLIQHKKEKVDLERFWKQESMGVTETETTTTDVNS